ncbi:hypothetical protein ACIQWI_14165 [Peribacillus frigoritolerans]
MSISPTYRLLHNVINYTPYPIVVKVVGLLEGDLSLIGKYKKQAELLGLEINQVQQAWGYIYDLILEKVR